VSTGPTQAVGKKLIPVENLKFGYNRIFDSRDLQVRGAILLVAMAWMAHGQTGEGLYLSQCAMCHGARGEGGRGSILTRVKLRHAPDDEALYRVIRRGIPGSGMPGTGFSDREIRLVMEHVRSLAKVVPGPSRGDAVRGERVYYGKGGCAKCHTIGGRGGAFGPDLNAIGARRNPTHLLSSLIDPTADVPRGFVMVQAIKHDRTITGARLNEDTFSIQIRDAGGALHSFWKTELRELRLEPGKSGMPGYRDVLSDHELEDVVAFLAGLVE
jgi:cytochrome c oxidase cbb3-type subunit 3